MPDQINTRRRRLLGTTVAGISLMELGLSGLAKAQSNGTPSSTKTATRVASFDNIRQVNAGTLSIGYAEAGPQNGPVVILLHGWPYDIYSFAEVTPLLASAGYRVIVPYLRGYGSTRFLSADTPRNGQQAVVAVDIIRWLRLGRAHGEYHCGAVAAAMHGDGVGKRLSDRESGGQQDAAAAEG
jgi:hypothetical protein